MKSSLFAAALALGLMLVPAAAMADDPNDPAMRDAGARARDHATIQRLNRQQLAYVQQRDAGYAEGWRDWREARGGKAAYSRGRGHDADSAQGNYARERARYERDMAQWRRAVAACRAGDYSACD